MTNFGKHLKHIFWLFLLIPCLCLADNNIATNLPKAPIDSGDLASLQRGARLYMNYCSGCHSLQYLRYDRMAEDLNLVKGNGEVDKSLVQTNLIFTNAKITDPIYASMQPENAKNWFGVAPPDLSVIARARGVDWLYAYLLSFYQDDKRPFGVNNLVFKDTAMPDALANLRGVQIPIYKNVVADNKVFDHFASIKPGKMAPRQFAVAVADIVNFLDYASEPNKSERYQMSWLLGFLLLLALLIFFLKKEYWKNIRNRNNK